MCVYFLQCGRAKNKTKGVRQPIGRAHPRRAPLDPPVPPRPHNHTPPIASSEARRNLPRERLARAHKRLGQRRYPPRPRPTRRSPASRAPSPPTTTPPPTTTTRRPGLTWASRRPAPSASRCVAVVVRPTPGRRPAPHPAVSASRSVRVPWLMVPSRAGDCATTGRAPRGGPLQVGTVLPRVTAWGALLVRSRRKRRRRRGLLRENMLHGLAWTCVCVYSSRHAWLCAVRLESGMHRQAGSEVAVLV